MRYVKGFCLIMLLMILGNCVKHYQYPKYEDSNQIFIENTIKKLDIGEKLDYKILKDSKVVLRSLEINKTLDYPLIAMLEDNLIRSLVKKRFRVLERDENAMKNMIEESQNEKYSILYKNRDKEGEYYLKGETAEGEKILRVQEEPITLYKTQLSSADYIVSYRILECGLNYQELEEDEEYIKRNGLVRIFVRVQKLPSGEIKYANTLEAKHSDRIKEKFVDPLESFHYAFYSHKYPIQGRTAQ